MISPLMISAGALFLAIGWLGGRSWMKVVFPDIQEPLTLVYLPLMITGAVLIVSLTVLDRIRVPLTFWSVLSVVILNTLIPGALVLGQRLARRSHT